MDIGLAVPTHGLLTRDDNDFILQAIEPADVRIVDFAQRAERLGFHSLWFSDHVVMGGDNVRYPNADISTAYPYPPQPTMFEGIVTMAAVAATTSSIGIATSVHIAPYRHPLVSAHQLATIDYMSGGRLIVGVGVGFEEQEYAALDADFAHRGPVTEESIQIYKRAWTEDFVNFDGEHFEISNVSMNPKPLQSPHPPILYGGTSKVGGRRAARVADGLYTVHLGPLPAIDVWRPAKLACLEEAERIGRDMSDFWYGTFASALLCDAGDPVVAKERRPVLTGTAEQILEELAGFAAEGYGHVTLHLDVPSNSRAALDEHVERIAAEVLPEAATIEPAPLI
jgi:probable F420-dependent oxidoreductase